MRKRKLDFGGSEQCKMKIIDINSRRSEKVSREQCKNNKQNIVNSDKVKTQGTIVESNSHKRFLEVQIDRVFHITHFADRFCLF